VSELRSERPRNASTNDESREDRGEPRPLRTSDIAASRRPDEPEHDTTDQPTVQPLFHAETAEELRRRWGTIQTSFVDEPRRAVEQGDELVADVVQRLSQSFATERSNLEQQWDRGDQVSTEDLRVALQRYRSFFERLLAA
jgi:hypothetical protein